MSSERKYLVIDTETSGLFDFTKPADADGQPRMASLAMIFLDAGLIITSEVHMFVKPVGWEMAAEAGAVVGIAVAEVLNQYVQAVDDGRIVVAFNAQFDTKVLRGELRRAQIDDRFEKTPTICTMRASTDVVKVPRKTGRGWKFPKLGEACAHFKIVNADAHSALHDARACVEILRCLVALGECPEPAVYFAKERP